MMNAARPAGVALVTIATVFAGCLFIDNPGPAESTSTTDTSVGGSGGGAPSDAGSDADAIAPPPLCDKYGGYATVEAVVGLLVGNLVADCRISAFFTALTPERQQHLGDCLTKQVAVLMHCPGIKYDTDSNGADCRDMKTTHHGLGIRATDFDALIEDVVATLQQAGVEQADIEAMAPALLFLKDDIVTNSAPGAAKDTCDAGDGG